MTLNGHSCLQLIVSVVKPPVLRFFKEKACASKTIFITIRNERGNSVSNNLEKEFSYKYDN